MSLILGEFFPLEERFFFEELKLLSDGLVVLILAVKSISLVSESLDDEIELVNLLLDLLHVLNQFYLLSQLLYLILLLFLFVYGWR